MNNQSTFIPHFRQLTRFPWTDTGVSENASPDKFWVVKELLVLSEDGRQRWGIYLVSVKADSLSLAGVHYRLTITWGQTSPYPLNSSLHAGGVLTTCFLPLAHTAVLIITISRLMLKRPLSSETSSMGLHRALHATPALLQRTECGLMCRLEYWLIDRENVVRMSYRNQCIILRD